MGSDDRKCYRDSATMSIFSVAAGGIHRGRWSRIEGRLGGGLMGARFVVLVLVVCSVESNIIVPSPREWRESRGGLRQCRCV